eukprot:393888_1
MDENVKQKQINHETMELRYKKAEAIERGIQTRLRKWKDANRLQHRKGEIIISFIVVLVTQIAVIGILRNSAFSSDVATGAKVFCLWMYIGDAAMLTFVVVTIKTTITHYSFPELIMNQLSKPIDCKTVGELISWWELRKCYLEVIIAIHASGLSGLLFTALSGNMVCVILFLVWNKSDISLVIILAVFIVVISCWTFLGVSSAVNFHNNQMNH